MTNNHNQQQIKIILLSFRSFIHYFLKSINEILIVDVFYSLYDTLNYIFKFFLVLVYFS